MKWLLNFIADRLETPGILEEQRANAMEVHVFVVSMLIIVFFGASAYSSRALIVERAHGLIQSVELGVDGALKAWGRGEAIKKPDNEAPKTSPLKRKHWKRFDNAV